jgi:hypothetical protein
MFLECLPQAVRTLSFRLGFLLALREEERARRATQGVVDTIPFIFSQKEDYLPFCQIN